MEVGRSAVYALPYGLPAMGRRIAKLTEINAVDDETECVNVVIETTRGARTKLAYDPQRGAFVVRKVLPEGMSFPFDFGFIPSTKGDDGDPLDVLLLQEDSVPAGTVVPSRLIGVIEAIQTEDGETEENDRLLAVSAACELYGKVRKIGDLPPAVTEQIDRFFVNYNKQEGKQFEVKDHKGPKRADQLLEAGRRLAGRGRRKNSR